MKQPQGSQNPGTLKGGVSEEWGWRLGGSGERGKWKFSVWTGKKQQKENQKRLGLD